MWVQVGVCEFRWGGGMWVQVGGGVCGFRWGLCGYVGSSVGGGGGYVGSDGGCMWVQVGGLQWGEENKGANVRGVEGEQRGKIGGGGSSTESFCNLSSGFEMD